MVISNPFFQDSSIWHYITLMNIDESTKIGESLVKVRKTKGMSQADLARSLKISTRTLCSYEKGVRRLPSTMVKQLCEILGVSADEVLGITPVKEDGRTAEARLIRKFRDAIELPEDDRQLLVQMLNTLLAKQRNTASS